MRKVLLFLLLTVSLLFSGNLGIKLFTGGMYGSYGDLNLFVDYESSWLNFYNNNWAKNLKDWGFISNYTSTDDVNFKKLTISLPITLRLYMEKGKTTFFVEGSYIGGRVSNNKQFNYSITFPDSSTTRIMYTYSPLELKSNLFGAGIGISRDLFQKGWFKITGEVSIGAIFLNFHYRNFLTSKTEVEDYWLSIEYNTKMKGNGLGFYGYAALDIPVISKGRFTMSIRPGYIYSKILSIKGPTSYTYSISDSYGFSSTQSDSWNGEWFIKEIDANEWWGSVKFRFPSNYRGDLNDYYVKEAGKLSPSIHGPFITISIGFSL